MCAHHGWRLNTNRSHSLARLIPGTFFAAKAFSSDTAAISFLERFFGAAVFSSDATAVSFLERFFRSQSLFLPCRCFLHQCHVMLAVLSAAAHVFCCSYFRESACIQHRCVIICIYMYIRFTTCYWNKHMSLSTYIYIYIHIYYQQMYIFLYTDII